MSEITCSICGNKIDENDDINSCLSCGAIICKDHYDGIMGVCKNCSDNGPFFGC